MHLFGSISNLYKQKTTNFKLLFLLTIVFGLGCNSSQNNRDVKGDYATINGIKMYYEISGKGFPLIVIHGNGGDIQVLEKQIEFFEKHYQVIAMDCRGRGKTELGNDTLSYVQLTQDIKGLMEHLKIEKANILGYSDGGIVALMLGMNYPEKVNKLVSFGANLVPDTSAVYPKVLKKISSNRKHADSMFFVKDTSKDWRTISALMRLMEFQPNISTDDLKKIKAETLILVSDDDKIIKKEHGLFISKSINGAKFIAFPEGGHKIIETNAKLFNEEVFAFLSQKSASKNP
jgi:pimeloyl-ACP methyl ester carboxylesterase